MRVFKRLTSNHLAIIGMLLTTCLILASYSNVLNAPFVFDDLFAIRDNQSIRSIWPLSKALWAPQDLPTAGRPIINLSFALNYWFGENDVYGYHLANIGIHILNTLLFASLLSRTLATLQRDENSILKRCSPAIVWTVSSLWALHPLQTETVSYVTQRTELLMASFLFFMLYAAHRGWDATRKFERFAWYGGSIAACAFGMACKEVMVVAPVLLVFYDLAIFRVSFRNLMRKRIALYLSAFATWAILIGLLSTNPRGQTVGFSAGYSPWLYFTTQCWAIVHYLFLVLWPSQLCGDYGVFGISEFNTWGPRFVGLVALAALTVWSWTRNRAVSLIGIWFFIILAPTSSFVPIASEPVAERRMYLPLVAPLLLVILAFVFVIERIVIRVQRSIGKPRISSENIVAIVGLCLVFGSSAITYSRNQVYASQLSFWQDVIAKRPVNPRAFSSLGLLHFEDGDNEQAMQAYHHALAIAPGHLETHINLGNLYLSERRFEESRRHLDQALEINPKSGHALSLLGKWFVDQNDPVTALTYLDAAIKIIPDHGLSAYNRAIALANSGRIQEAIAEYKRALILEPKMAMAYNNLGHIELSQGNLQVAEVYFRQAIASDANSSYSRTNLGTVFAKRGQFAVASEHFEKALSIDPNLLDAHFNLGICYAKLEKSEMAIQEFRSCIALNATDVGAWSNLGSVYLSQGKPSEARECFAEALRLDPNSEDARNAFQSLDALAR